MIKKDPDIDIAYLFLIGDHIPKSWGTRKLGFMPYNFQHSYFFFCKHFPSSGRYMYCKSEMIYCRNFHFFKNEHVHCYQITFDSIYWLSDLVIFYSMTKVHFFKIYFDKISSFTVGPPLLLPIYFHIENIMFVFKRKDYLVSKVSQTRFLSSCTHKYMYMHHSTMVLKSVNSLIHVKLSYW